jgi:hypothetical protein
MYEVQVADWRCTHADSGAMPGRCCKPLAARCRVAHPIIV